VYESPHEFRPQRFVDGQPAPYTWIPFGGGVRRCLGAAFAQLEIRTVLQTVVARAALHAPDPAPEGIRLRHVTLVPEHGTRVTMDARRALAPATATAGTYA
jgi:cytochrome P450